MTLHPSHQIERGNIWAFTDGGADGWHAAVLLDTAGRARCVCFRRPNEARNVGSELDGVILAIELALELAADRASEEQQLIIVSDFLWSAFYINGWRAVRHAYLVERVPVARGLLQRAGFAKTHFIHHGGHDGRATDFSTWNDVADRLCKGRTTVETAWGNAAEVAGELSQ